MDRFIALLKRFDNQANEDLFPICADQLAEIYSLEPEVYSVALFHKIKDFLVGKVTYKRQIAAALVEKIAKKLATKKDFSAFLVHKGKFDFAVEDFIEQMHKSRRKKAVKNIEDFKKIMAIDLLNFSQEQVRVQLSKRENCLYSTCKKKLETKEKLGNRNSRDDEQNVLQEFEEKGEKDFDFIHEKRQSTVEEEQKFLKKLKDTKEESAPSKNSFENFTTVLDLVFELATYLVFHQSWEVRHGSLLVFRSIARTVDQFYILKEFFTQGVV